MSWGDSVGTSGAGGGYGGGHSSTDGGGRGGGTGFDGRDTPGAPNAPDGKRGSTMGRNGGIAGSAIESFADVMDARPDPEAGFMGKVDGQAVPSREIDARATRAIRSSARSGLFGSALTLGAGLLGSPIAGMAVDTAARGVAASKAAKDHNAEFGTNVDTGLASNIGAQAKGAVAGMAGGKIGSTIGGRLGMAAGPYAGAAGALAGGLIGGQMGRNAGLNGMTGDATSAGDGDAQGTPGGGEGTTYPQLASRRLPSVQEAARDDAYNGPGQIGRYGSYAASFFS